MQILMLQPSHKWVNEEYVKKEVERAFFEHANHFWCQTCKRQISKLHKKICLGPVTPLYDGGNSKPTEIKEMMRFLENVGEAVFSKHGITK